MRDDKVSLWWCATPLMTLDGPDYESQTSNQSTRRLDRSRMVTDGHLIQTNSGLVH